MTDNRPDPSLVDEADIVFAATVHADRLRFETVPETAVEFDGEPAHESGDGSRRDNLPDQVKDGEVYRNVRVEYVMAAKLRNVRREQT